MEGRATGLKGRIRPRAQSSWLSVQDLFSHVSSLDQLGLLAKIERFPIRSLNLTWE